MRAVAKTGAGFRFMSACLPRDRRDYRSIVRRGIDNSGQLPWNSLIIIERMRTSTLCIVYLPRTLVSSIDSLVSRNVRESTRMDEERLGQFATALRADARYIFPLRA